VELSQPYALSDLIGRPVCDASGRGLGRVFELRGRHEGEGIVIDAILVGRQGLVARLRGPAPRARTIPWAQVSEIGDRILIAGYHPATGGTKGEPTIRNGG
jgi:sporulation protein YlmC with PRC-barrel domain